MSETQLKLNLKEIGFPVPVTIEQELPANPEIRKIANDILSQLKYSFMAVAANPQAKVPGRAHSVFQSFLMTRKPAKREIYQNRSQTFLKASPAVREATFGRYGKIDLEQYSKNGSDNLPALAGKLEINPQKLQAALSKAFENDAKFTALPSAFFVKADSAVATAPKVILNLAGSKQAADIAAGAKFKKVGLFIKEVHCIEETDEIGSDEINIGGNVIDADGKTTRLIDQFVVSSDFDEGEKKVYGSGKLFAEWKLINDNKWPKAYASVMAMAEKDDGGFYNFLKEMWELVDDKVKAAVTGAVGAAIGGAIGGVIGMIAGFVLGAFVGWLINLFNNPDDIVAVKPLTLWLKAATGSYYELLGLTKEPPKLFKIDFVGDGGHYRVWCYYKVY